MLERRGKHIEHRKIEIGFDNRMQHWNLIANVKKSDMHAQEAGAEIAMIKHWIKNIEVLEERRQRHIIENHHFLKKAI